MTFWKMKKETSETSYMPEVSSGGGEWYFGDQQRLAVVMDNVEMAETKSGKPVIKIRWSVVGPEKDAKGIKMMNRKVFQSLYPEGSDFDETQDKKEKTIAKAEKMVMCIDDLFGGKIMSLGRAPNTEELMQHWVAKPPITIRVGLMINKSTKQPERNYVNGVGPYEANVPLKEGAWKRDSQEAHAISNVSNSSGFGSGGMAIDDEIPFSPSVL